jgi:hypothetical protein
MPRQRRTFDDDHSEIVPRSGASSDMRHLRLRSERTGAQAVGASAVGATVIWGVAIGSIAIGALAIGALAIGGLAIGRARFRRLEIDDLVVRKLRITDELQAPAKLEVEG